MYPHIISKLNRTVWASTPQTVEAIRDLLRSRMSRGGQAPELSVDDAPLLRHSAAALAMFGGEAGRERKPYAMNGSTAIVPVFGVIGKHLGGLEMMCGGLDVDHLLGCIEMAVADSDSEQVLLWFNSPGGVVTGVPEAARRIAFLNTQKSIYAYTDGMCCSAGYWLASQCENVFAAPSADVGSIGVYLSWINASEAYEREGLHLELFKAGEFKAMGHPLKDVSEAEADMLQADVETIWADFKAACTARRSIEESTMQGQCFSYAAQISTGLVDAHYDRLADLLADLEQSAS